MYDDDDLADYDDYGEDDALDEVLAVLGKSVSEDEAVAALEKSDYDVDVAIASLRAKLAARKKSSPAPSATKPAPSAAKAPSVVKAPTQGKSGPAAAAAGASGLSRLQQLAQARRAGEAASSDSGNAKTSALDRLRNRSAPASGGMPSKLPLKGLQSTGQSKGLAGLASRKTPTPGASRGASPSPASSSSVGGSASGSTTSLNETEVPQISYDFSPASLSSPSSLGALLAAVPNTPNSLISNSVTPAKQAPQAFAKPSPDEVVLNAQDRGFASQSAEKAVASSKAASPAPAKGTSPAPKTKATKPKDELVANLQALRVKPHLSFVVIGHVDAGKSTLMGRLLLDTGAVSKRAVDKFEHESSKLGKSSFALAWVMDATTEERERGVTVDVGEASFETAAMKFTVVDAPGHKDYVPNMIAGVAQADVAVMVVDSDTNAFESGFSLDGQTKEHAVLARSLGIDTMVVAVNKLDIHNWNMDRFQDIKVQLTEFLTKQVGYAKDKLVFVPTSGKTGGNVVSKADIPGYSGPSLVQALEQVGQREHNVAGPLRFVVSNVYHEEYQPHTTIVGRVVSGAVEKDDPVVDASRPDSQPAVVKDVEGNVAVAGDVAELKVDVAADEVRPGDVLCAPENVLKPVTEFQARVVLFDLKRPLLTGAKVSFYMGRVNQTAKLLKVDAVLDKAGKPKDGKPPRHLIKGQNALVVLQLAEPVVVAPFSESKDLGRFVLRLDGSTIGGGVVVSV